MNYFNEKPSKYTNLGEDITGAKRHNFDTYENPEEREKKERSKQSKKHISKLKEQAIASMHSENYVQVLQDYEYKRALEFFEGFTGPREYSKEALSELKDYVMSKIKDGNFNKLAGKFNRLNRVLYKIYWRLDYADAQRYFTKKKRPAFIEHNGIKRPWALDCTFDKSNIEHLSKSIKAVQFGNSLSENEREYCLHNLSIALKILDKYFSFDFKTIGFSFGARGKKGSVAHYEDRRKVLAFNRGWDGSLIHELGHAIDYSLGLLSNDIPQSIRSKYKEKLIENKIDGISRMYLMKNVEIFARLFEQYVTTLIPEITSFMQHTFDIQVMPELDDEAKEFMNTCLKSVLKETR